MKKKSKSNKHNHVYLILVWSFFLFLLIILQSFTLRLYAQEKIIEKSGEKPYWVSVVPDGINCDYYKAVGQANSLNEAQRIALNNVYRQLNNKGKSFVSTRGELITDQTILNGKIQFNQHYVEVISSKEDTLIVEGLGFADDYWQKYEAKSGNYYNYWILMNTPKLNCKTCSCIRLDESKFSLIRSLIVPGWGQRYYYKDKNKGWFFTSSYFGTISLGIISMFYSNRNYDNSFNAFSNVSKEFYLDRARSWQNISYLSFSSALIINAFNIIQVLGLPKKLTFANNYQLYPAIYANSLNWKLNINF